MRCRFINKKWRKGVMVMVAAIVVVSIPLALYEPNENAYETTAVSLALVVVVTSVQSAGQNYSLALSTLQCYAGVQNYSFHIIAMEEEEEENNPPLHRSKATSRSNMTSAFDERDELWIQRAIVEKCKERWRRELKQSTHIREAWGTPFKFQRHCAVAEFMAAHPHYEYVLFLDADIGVINPERRIEEFIDEDQRTNLYFYNKDANKNIMAGSYLAKNTEQSRRFLLYIADYIWLLGDRAKNVYYKNPLDPGAELHDNSVFNAILLQKFGTAAELEKCEKYFEPKNSIYIACTRHYLNKHAEEGGIYYTKEEVGRVKILPKFEGWARDGTTANTEKWSVEKDFMLHGWKQSQLDLPTPTSKRRRCLGCTKALRGNHPPRGRPQHWTSPLVGETPFEASEEQCRPERKSEVIRRFWKERWNSGIMLSGKKLYTLLEEKREMRQRKFDRLTRRHFSPEVRVKEGLFASFSKNNNRGKEEINNRPAY